MKYIIKQSLNNNIVLVSDQKGLEHIFIGNGIGFNAKPKQVFSRIENVKREFILKAKDNIENYSRLINSTDLDLVSFLEEEIANIEIKIGKKLDERIHVNLIDHVAFAIQRHKDGLDFHNPLDANIRIMYKQEYEYATELLKNINKKFNIGLIDDEISFLAIHIHAATESDSVRESRAKIEIATSIINKIYEKLSIKKDIKSYSYQRLLLHTSYALERMMQKEAIDIDSCVIKSLKDTYAFEFNVVSDIMKQIKEEYDIEFPESEIAYITIHVIKISQEKIEG